MMEYYEGPCIYLVTISNINETQTLTLDPENVY